MKPQRGEHVVKVLVKVLNKAHVDGSESCTYNDDERLRGSEKQDAVGSGWGAVEDVTGDHESSTSGDEEGLHTSENRDAILAECDFVLRGIWGSLIGLRSANRDAVWAGWDALIIESKRGKVDEVISQVYYDRRVPEEDSAKEMTLKDYEELCLGKRKARETLKTGERDVTSDKIFELVRLFRKKKEDNHLIKLKIKKDNPKKKDSLDKEVHKAFHASLWSAAIEEGKYRWQVEMIAKAVACLTLRAMSQTSWPWLEQQLPRDVYKNFRDSVFRSIAKFVLSVFDMEDFERIYNISMVINEYKLLSSNLSYVESKGECNPLIAVAEGRMNLDKFSFLREYDVADVLWQRHGNSKNPRFLVTPRVLPIRPVDWFDVSQCYVRSAMRVMQKYVPLKEDCKMQLTLELTRGKCFHVLDTLYLEAWKGIKIQEFRRFDEKSDDLSEFADVLHNGIYDLANMKEIMLQHFQQAITFPITSDVFGPCTDEVLDVVRIADQERRMQGHRFISVPHILFGLLQTRIGDSVKRIISDRGLNNFSEEPSKFLLFNIYKSSRDVARLVGDKEMGLEHLFLAILFGKQKIDSLISKKEEIDSLRKKSSDIDTSMVFDDTPWDAELLQCLRSSERTYDVRSWTDPDVWSMFLPKTCVDGGLLKCSIVFMAKKLDDACKAGFILPAIR